MGFIDHIFVVVHVREKFLRSELKGYVIESLWI